ncbi:MAG TPA: c-type cytochrome domain-containing protein [Ignavibacteriaceae bacterium]|nr:c-type cytochrome domain-containing protein [Ignavibacteriaceae bacterium]
MKKLLFTISILIFAFILTNCDDTITVDDVDNRVIPDSNVSFSEHIVPVLQAKCYSCHANGRYEAGLDLSLHTRFVDGRIVVPGSPETSILIWTIEPGGNPQMPPVGTAPSLTKNQLDGFRTWVDEGAKNN